METLKNEGNYLPLSEVHIEPWPYKVIYKKEPMVKQKQNHNRIPFPKLLRHFTRQILCM